MPLDGRQEHREALDERISQATRDRYAAPLAALLRQVGVPAHKSANSLDLISDSHLWERETYATVTDAFGKLRPIIGAPWRFAHSPTKLARGAPSMGEHNAYVYCDLLGLSEEELQALIDDGTVA